MTLNAVPTAIEAVLLYMQLTPLRPTRRPTTLLRRHLDIAVLAMSVRLHPRRVSLRRRSKILTGQPGQRLLDGLMRRRPLRVHHPHQPLSQLRQAGHRRSLRAEDVVQRRT